MPLRWSAGCKAGAALEERDPRPGRCGQERAIDHDQYPHRPSGQELVALGLAAQWRWVAGLLLVGYFLENPGVLAMIGGALFLCVIVTAWNQKRSGASPADSCPPVERGTYDEPAITPEEASLWTERVQHGSVEQTHANTRMDGGEG